ncbi:MAG: ATP-binding protein [Bacteroidales bacterium]|nr:ATP-binding protein [Bacteroidales bacterium]
MRFLSKIVLIKSASFDFQELYLDGNVHFTGDQGTGKSTIQRAILFLYNADSQNLGIKAKQDNFADFYLPNTNSHIIYEINTENSKFTIWLHKESNHVCYRFIAAPYNQEYFVENTAKGFFSRNPEDVLGDLRQRNIRVHRQITKYTEFRDILYGNIDNSKQMREFANYYLFKSPVYHNIPKTITSIFLNSELKSSDIKNTIIQSLSQNDFQQNEGKGYVIDLPSLKRQLSDFAKDYHDINNYSKIQKRAESIIAIYNEIQSLEQDKILTAQQIGSNIKVLKSKLEFSEQEKNKLNNELTNQTNSEKDFADKYKKEYEAIKKEIDVLEDKIKTAEKKQLHYNSIEKFELKGITKILERVNQEVFFEKEKRAKQQELDVLLTQYKSIEEKYRTLTEKLDIETQNYQNTISEKKNELSEFEYRQKEIISNRHDEWRKNFDKDFSILQDQQEQQKDALNKNLLELLKNRDEINKTEFFKELIQEQKDEISQNNVQFKENDNSILIKSKEIENLKNQSEFENKEILNDYNIKKSDIERSRKQCKDEISEIEDKLHSFENSFYEFLNKNNEGWQETIGKVCDENILFSQFLSPEIVNINDLFYGIKINLDEIPVKVKTIAEYNQNLQELNEKLKEISIQFEKLVNENEQNKVKIEKKFNDKVKPLNKSIQDLKAENQQILLKNKRLELKINELTEQAKHKKAEELAKIQPQIKDVELKLNNIKLLIKNSKIEYSKTIEQKQTDKKNEISHIEKSVKEDKIKFDIQLSNFIKNQEIKKRQYETDKENELTGKGANTKIITDLENTIAQIQKKLDQIQTLKEIVSVYNSDLKEWINELPNFKENKKIEETNLSKLNAGFQEKKDEFKKIKNNISKKIEIEDKAIDSLKKQSNKYEDFSTNPISINVFTDVEYYILSSTLDSDETDISQLIDHIKDIYIKLNEQKQDLQAKVTKFLSPFKEKNIFGFPVNISETSQLFDFAENLTEFVAENKYAEYQKYFKELYARLISLIVGDIDRLTSKFKEISEIVESKMNKDLEKRNFVSVVQKVELKVETSQNKIIQTFQEIKKFNDSNPFHFGETNLFSGQELEASNDKALQLLTALLKNIEDSTLQEISLKDTFELKFRVIENQKDTNWQEKLTDIGSEGTDILVKAMIYITLLYVFKEKVSKKVKDFQLHCIMDEIGRIHPKNVESLIKYANERGILMINGSPVENNALAYKHVYDFKRTKDSKTKAIKQITID